MADNTDEEHLNNPEINQSENSSDEIAFNANTENINSNQETENMEVHHHAHHGHEKKTWKNYFWEFFMLFLAVFCGFLAEYQLEHKIENDREYKYVKALINDLVQDTVDANIRLERNLNRILTNDSLLKLFGKDFARQENSRSLYSYFLKTTGLPIFEPHTSTMTQLKNSGSLRLIHKQEIINEILQYNQLTLFLETINNAYEESYKEIWKAAAPVMHINLFYDSSFADYNKKTVTSKLFPPIKCSSEVIDIFFGAATTQQRYTTQQVTLLRRQISAASKLIKFLKNEYNLD
jgi:hypothetical protein